MTDKIEITIDVSELTLGDIEAVMAEDYEPTFKEQLDLLDKVVVSDGGSRAIPVVQVQAVIVRVREELEALVNPTTDEVPLPENESL